MNIKRIMLAMAVFGLIHSHSINSATGSDYSASFNRAFKVMFVSLIAGWTGSVVGGILGAQKGATLATRWGSTGNTVIGGTIGSITGGSIGLLTGLLLAEVIPNLSQIVKQFREDYAQKKSQEQSSNEQKQKVLSQ